MPNAPPTRRGASRGLRGSARVSFVRARPKLFEPRERHGGGGETRKRARPDQGHASPHLATFTASVVPPPAASAIRFAVLAQAPSTSTLLHAPRVTLYFT